MESGLCRVVAESLRMIVVERSGGRMQPLFSGGAVITFMWIGPLPESKAIGSFKTDKAPLACEIRQAEI